MAPFTIDIPEAVLDDLRERLTRTRWPTAVEGAGWDRGTDIGYLRDLIAYWAEGYDWRTHEAELNALNHVRVDVDGFGLHAVHQPAVDGDAAMPLLLLHGWPDSFLRYRKVLPLLAQFDVVVPSLPGYGFSDKPTRPGYSSQRFADLMAELMTQLGYDRFLVSGGDIGAGVAEGLGFAHPDRLIGLHLTDVPYWHPDRRFSRDEVLTHLTVYWVTETIATSFGPYDEGGATRSGRVEVPTGVTIFPHDLVPAPREFGDRFFDVRHWSRMPRGGHFGAWEEPELFAQDLTAFAAQL